MTLNSSSPAEALTLANCDREPIHIPGAIQPHGVLLAFDAHGVLTHRSTNAETLLGSDIPRLGEKVDAGHFGRSALVLDALAEGLGAAQLGGAEAVPLVTEVELQGRTFELIIHSHADAMVAEFETWPDGSDDLAAFALKAHRGMDRLRRLRSVDALLSAAVDELRKLTGFDRVMAYRFRHDDSGDIVAESCIDSLEPFVGRRYPASDIPAQARRLYVINTLRLIGDVGAIPVAVESSSHDAPPLDMSYSVLRSVSPVHIEYLTNMGVGASMSVSIVINGQLWGMLACHHMTPRRVHHSVRLACDVLAQFLAANIHTVTAREQAQRFESAASLRSQLVGRVLHSDDVLGAMSAVAQDIQDVFQAHALLLVDDGRQTVHGAVDAAAARSLLQWLAQHEPGSEERLLVQTHATSTLPADLQPALAAWPGVLALRFDAVTQGWLVLLRKEQVETIQWGGRPEKIYVNGPLGPRLTPRGSFDLWREEVRGEAVPWSETELEIAGRFLDELLHATSARGADIARARSHLFAIFSQNLSDPLRSLAQAASGLDDGSADETAIAERIQSSSSRMQRLVAQVLDISRLQSGAGLPLQRSDVDLAKIVNEVVKEAQTAFPGTRFIREVPREFQAHVDSDRMREVIANLVFNAGRYGAADEPVLVQLYQRDGDAVLDVSNVGEPISAELEPLLFDPIRRQSVTQRHQRGMGLGLYISHAVVQGHAGTLQYNYAEPYIVFSASLPNNGSQKPDNPLAKTAATN